MGCAKRGAANGQTPLASRATKQTARKGAPDSVSRSVVREGTQAAARNTVKTGRSCCRSRTPSFADRVAAAVPPGCGKIRRLCRCAPRCRSPSYDLRRAPCIHPHFASNASRGGLNRRSLYVRSPKARKMARNRDTQNSLTGPRTNHVPAYPISGLESFRSTPENHGAPPHAGVVRKRSTPF